MKLKQVKTVEQVEELALQRKCVFSPNRDRKAMPASVLLSMQGRCILAYIKAGLFVYEPKKKKQFYAKDFKPLTPMK